MSECPDVTVLERGAAPDHVAGCASCRIVAELLRERKRAVDSRDRRAECAQFEMLLAARDEGTLRPTAAELLEAHLRACRECCALAATAAPLDDSRPATLPQVSTAAYALGREVGRGGMARIIAAQDLRIGRPVALKEPLGRSASLAARFEREARVTARLQHPGIVPIYEIGSWPDGTPFYSMRMVEGRTLRDAIHATTSLDERLALLPAVLMAVDAVAFAHGQHIVHRDLTPANILVGAHGDTVVIDWGLAKDLAAHDPELAAPYRDSPADPNLTHAGAVLGTAAYMPPEQGRGDAVDERADVYALGAILYHLLGGLAPYRGTTSDEVVRLVLAGPPGPLVERAPGAPRDLVSIVEKAMAREPAARYANASELAGELRRFQTGRLVEAHHYSRGERAGRWLRARRTVVLASVAALVALGVAGSLGIAGIVRERDLADRINADLLEEQGRQAVLADKPIEAAVWLSAAYTAGDHSTALRVLLAAAMRDVEAAERTLDCGSSVHGIEVTPDHALLVVACDRDVRIWRVADGARVHTLAVPDTSVRAVRVSHDGTRVVVRSADAARVWDLATGRLLLTLRGHTERISNAAFSASDRLILTSSFDRTVRIWDAGTGALVRSITALPDGQRGVRAGFVRDDLVVTVAVGGDLGVWSVATGERIRTLHNGAQPLGGDIEGGTDAQRIAVCGIDGVARIWDVDEGLAVATFVGHAGPAWTCKISGDGRRLLTVGYDGTAKVWDIASGNLVRDIATQGEPVQGDISPDGQTVVIGGPEAGLRVVDVPSGMTLGMDETGGGFDERLVTVDDRIFVGFGTAVHVWRGLGARSKPFRVPDGMEILDVSADTTRAAVAAQDVVTIWDTVGNAPVQHEPLRRPAYVSNDRMVAATATGAVIVDMQSGATVARVPVTAPGAFELSSDGRFLLVQRDDAPSEAWDVRTNHKIVEWPAVELPTGLRTGNDHLLVWTHPMAPDGRCEIWSLSPPHVERRLDVGTTGEGWFTPDHKRLLLYTTERMPAVARLWDLESGHELRAIPGAMFAKVDVTGAYAPIPTYAPQATGTSTSNPVLPGATEGRVQLVRLADGATVTTFPADAGGADVASDASLIAVAGMVRSSVQVWSRDGRLLATMPYPNRTSFTEDSMQVGSRRVVFASDGSRVLSLQANDFLSLPLTQEMRSPETVAEIVSRRAPWRVEHGHLVPNVPPRATLTGTLTHRGQPVGNALVTVTSDNDDPIVTEVSNADGKYVIHELPVGRVKIGAVTPTAFAKQVAMPVNEGENRRDLTLDFEASIAGRLVDANGAPVGGLQVHSDCTGCEQPDSGDAVTDADGRFELRALMGGGSYDFRVITIGKDSHLVPVKPTTVRVAGPADHVTGVTVVLDRH